MRFRRSSLSVLIALALTAVCARDSRAQLPARDLVELPTFAPFKGFSVSADDSAIAYSVQETHATPDLGNHGIENWRRSLGVWITNVQTRESQRTCCSQGSAMLPAWSHDGRFLAFYKTSTLIGPDHNSKELEDFERNATVAVKDVRTGVLRNFLDGQCSYACAYIQPIWLYNNHSLLIPTRPQSSTFTKHQEESGKNDSNRAGSEVHETDHGIRVLRSKAWARQTANRSLDSVLARTVGWPVIDITVLDTRTGRSTRVLSRVRIGYVCVSPNQQRLAFADYDGNPPNSNFEFFDIYVVDLESFAVRKVASRVGIYPGSPQPFGWSSGGRYLAVSDQYPDNSGRRTKVLSDYIVIDVEQGSSHRIAAGTPDSWFGARTPCFGKGRNYVSFIRNNRIETWDVKPLRMISRISIPNHRLEAIVANPAGQIPNGSGDYAITVAAENMHTVQAAFWRVEAYKGTMQKLIEADRQFSFSARLQCFSSTGSRVFFTWSSSQEPDELYYADEYFKDLYRLTDFAVSLRHVAMGRSKIVSWTDGAGDHVEGILLLPPNFTVRHPYPLVVVTYPIATMVLKKNAFGLGSLSPVQNWQMLATRGYAVFMPDIPTRPQTRMADIADVVVSGIRKLIARGLADPSRIGVIGHSDGGYATLALLVQSKLFRAAVVIGGHSNLIEDCSYNYLRLVIEEGWGFGNTPWQDPSLYIRNSPYLYLNQLAAPLLILHGSADTAVPVHLGKEIFSALDQLDRKTVYVEYEGEEHVPDEWTIPHQLDASERIVCWFDSYLKAGSGLTKSTLSTATFAK